MQRAHSLYVEGLKSLATLASRCPARGGPGHVSAKALGRWATRGILLPDGRRLKLEVVRVAGRYMSSEAALERFIAAQSVPVSEDQPLPASARTTSKRQQASEQAAQALDRLGI